MRPDLDATPQGRAGSALSAPPSRPCGSASIVRRCAPTRPGSAPLRVWPRPSPCFRAAVAASERPGRLAPLLHRPPRGVRFAACGVSRSAPRRRIVRLRPRRSSRGRLTRSPAASWRCSRGLARRKRARLRRIAGRRARARTGGDVAAPLRGPPRFGRFHDGAAPSMPLSCGSQPPAGPSRVTRIHVPRDRPAAAARHRRAASASPRQRNCG